MHGLHGAWIAWCMDGMVHGWHGACMGCAARVATCCAGEGRKEVPAQFAAGVGSVAWTCSAEGSSAIVHTWRLQES